METDYKYWNNLRNTWTFSKLLCRVSRSYYLDIAERYQPRSFLDLGCGFGETYNLFNQNEMDLYYVGLDITSKFVDICQTRYPNADFVVGKIQELPYPESSFEMVSCRCVLEHLPDPHPAILEMARVSSGVVIIVWFQWPGDDERYSYKRGGYWENKYSKKRILDTVVSTGLRLVDNLYEGHHLIWILEKDKKWIATQQQ